MLFENIALLPCLRHNMYQFLFVKISFFENHLYDWVSNHYCKEFCHCIRIAIGYIIFPIAKSLFDYLFYCFIHVFMKKTAMSNYMFTIPIGCPILTTILNFTILLSWIGVCLWTNNTGKKGHPSVWQMSFGIYVIDLSWFSIQCIYNLHTRLYLELPLR